MRKPRVYGKSGNYHVTQRAVGQQPLFLCDEDRERFVSLLKKLTPQYGKLFAFALMGNHYHLLFQIHNISEFMHRLNTSYAVYFNRKYDRKGPLFQERYFSEPIEDDQYLLNCLQYILNNPVHVGHQLLQASSLWTSIKAYFGGEYTFVDKSLVSDHFRSEKELLDFLKENTKSIEFNDSERVRRISDSSLIRYAQMVCGRLDFAQASYKIKLKIAIKLRDRTPCSIKQLARIFDMSYSFLLHKLRRKVQRIIFTYADMFPDKAFEV